MVVAVALEATAQAQEADMVVETAAVADSRLLCLSPIPDGGDLGH